MSYKQRRDILTFLLVVTVYLDMFRVSHSVSLGQRGEGSTAYKVQKSTATRWEEIEQDNDAQQGGRYRSERINQGPSQRKSSQPGRTELRPESAVFPAEPISYYNVPTLSDSWSWTVGNIRTEPMSSPSDSGDRYQADFTGFHGVQGKVLGPSPDSSSHVSEWLAMSPEVQCEDSVMTFTASGKELRHLLVDREEASPISPFQLPPYCRYSVRTSWSDLEMMVPYDACYIIQENGSYVLPMLWWGSPLKLSCPVQTSTPAPPVSNSALSVVCSSYGMAVQINEQDIQILGVIETGRLGPFVSADCSARFPSHPGKLTFFIPDGAPCITSGNDRHLYLVVNDQKYILSCPVNPQFPPPPPTQEPIAQIPNIPRYPYPGFQYPPLSQVFPPDPQPDILAMAQATSSPTINPVQESSSQPFSKLPVGSSEYAPGWYYPYVPFYYPAATPAPTSAAKTSTTVPPASPNYLQYYLQMPYYPAAPVTQAPASFTPSPPPPLPSPPKQPVGPQYPVHGAFHPPASSSSYYHYRHFSYPGLEVQPASASHPTFAPPSPLPTTTTQTDSPSYPFGQFPAQTPNCYYPHPYYHPLSPPICHPPYQPLPQYPENQPPTITATMPASTSSTPSTTAGPTQHIPQLQCLIGRMVVFLPFAHPDTIQVRDQMKTWLFVASVSPQCGFMLQTAEGYGVILHSPLPACHSQLLTPTTVSLLLRFWDLSVAQYRSLDLRCPYQTTPVPVTPPVSPTSPSTTKDKVGPYVVPKHKVFCSSHQMTLEFPSGPFSGIVFKDIEGNQMSLQDAPKHCGYSARRGKDGKIHLIIQLHSRCHMSMQGKMFIITVVYMTVNGRQEAQFSCPVVIPGSGQECNIPSEQRLPCGPGSVSPPQCLSMGCCFGNHPPACYYPMDECTIDRHFVFSVPASLTKPSLSPALLVVAGNSTCKPQRVTSDYALFKIPMDGCGTRRVTVGNAVIYMVEVINMVQTLSLNYGTITRDSSVRLLVECRFLPGTALSVSYLVKTPTLGPEVPAQGVFGVQLRIAKDAQYSSYYPQNHPPLQMLLGKPLYLEVRLLNSPDPSLVLLVHFCVAYPLSGKAVWLLLYNGCPNPYDPALQQSVVSDPQPPTPQAQTRRFTISTFQFLPDGEFRDLSEENNFMCSTEICSPHDGPCVEGCFGL
ncbi:uncharacterized protein LOC116396968 [Anarrhichthys ocellatus]|uniref:uncharacterized protein LOC116396968 n=1 Tax=Anarrhichthys ocellatus TaxID=433405 RepID=UPI0012EDF5A6|nr:uncharacterized protein LOC116396968 [Anarrhichthys ocellatus]